MTNLDLRSFTESASKCVKLFLLAIIITFLLPSPSSIVNLSHPFLSLPSNKLGRNSVFASLSLCSTRTPSSVVRVVVVSGYEWSMVVFQLSCGSLGLLFSLLSSFHY